jgi:hypothetical protein
LIHALGGAGLTVDRVVWPEVALLAETQTETLTGIDSDRPAAQTAVWFVSLSFENDLVRLAGLLRLAGLPQLAEERGAHHPLIVVGGVAAICSIIEPTCAAFADCLSVGEGQAALGPFTGTTCRRTIPAVRDDFLARTGRPVPGAPMSAVTTNRNERRANGAFLGMQTHHGFPAR